MLNMQLLSYLNFNYTDPIFFQMLNQIFKMFSIGPATLKPSLQIFQCRVSNGFAMKYCQISTKCHLTYFYKYIELT